MIRRIINFAIAFSYKFQWGLFSYSTIIVIVLNNFYRFYSIPSMTGLYSIGMAIEKKKNENDYQNSAAFSDVDTLYTTYRMRCVLMQEFRPNNI